MPSRPLVLSRAAVRPTVSEKEEMARADEAAALLGFRVVRFSQPRATKQTPGIPDRLYLHPRKRAAFWWEAKSETGECSPAQMALHADLVRSGHVVCVGTSGIAIDEMKRITGAR